MSLLFAPVCAFLFWTVLNLKKSSKNLNGIEWIFVSIIVILCYGTIWAGVINLIHIPVTILSMGIIYLLTAGVLLWFNKKNGTQTYDWYKYDIFFVLAIFVIVIFFMIKYFSVHAFLIYYNSDSSVHFMNAAACVRQKDVSDMFFAPLHCALFIETLKPFIKEVEWYKFFILYDAGMFCLEIIFFFVMIREFLKNNWMKCLAVVICVFYACGYPMNSFLYSFLYLGQSVMIIGFIMYILRCYADRGFNRTFAKICIMLGCGTITVTYMLFGPITYIATFVVIMLVMIKEGKLVQRRNIVTMLLIFVLPCVISLYYSLVDFIKSQGLQVAQVVSNEGGNYRELYINFIWIIPLIIYGIIKKIKAKKIDETFIFMVSFLLMEAVLLVFTVRGIMSPYYYYKFYYPMWLIMFVFATEGCEELLKQSKEFVIAGLCTFGIIALLAFTDSESKIIAKAPALTYVDRSSGMFDIYKNNKTLFAWRFRMYNDEMIDICDYVISDLNSDKVIPLLTTSEQYVFLYWYEGITGNDCTGYLGWQYEFNELMDKIKNDGLEYYVVFKNTNIYTANCEYFDNQEHIYENEFGYVIKVQ